jgi:hypothetical protein
MKIFLDTASLDEIREGAAWGVVDGEADHPPIGLGHPHRRLAERVLPVLPRQEPVVGVGPPERRTGERQHRGEVVTRRAPAGDRARHRTPSLAT